MRIPRGSSLSLRARVAWAAGVATAALAVALSVVGIISTRHELRREVDSELIRDANEAAARTRRVAALTKTIPEFGNRPGRSSERSSRLLDSTGRIIAESTYPDVPVTGADRSVAAGNPSQQLQDVGSDQGTAYRVLTLSLGELGGRHLAVQVARPTAEIENSVTRLTWIFALCGLGGALVAVAAAWEVARSAVKPVGRLASAASHVADTFDLTVEVPEQGGTELVTLGRSFNRMLRALESSREQQRHLIADASHELRTPLTSLRTNIEVLTSEVPLPDSDRIAILSDLAAQVDELTGLVADLSELAKDEEAGTAEFTTVQLDEVVGAALERVTRRASGVRIVADLDPTAIEGHPGLLERAVLNVLDNAIKWSPPSGVVTVTLHDGALTVIDEGPGIAPEDRAHVFERFWRSAEARSQRGTGLGLAIVSQVVTSHHGTITIDDAHPEGATDGDRTTTRRGTKVTLTFPATSDRTPTNAP